MISDKGGYPRESVTSPEERVASSGHHEKAPSANGHLPPVPGTGIDDPVPVNLIVGVPATALSTTASPEVPEIIVIMSPNSAVAPVDPRGAPEEDSRTSGVSRIQEPLEESSERRQRFCVHMWGVCGAVTFPLVFSLWMLLVPYLVRTTRTTLPAIRPALTSPSTPTFTPPTDPSSPVTESTTDTSTGTTIDAWSGVPPTCRTPPVSAKLPATFQIGPHYNSTIPVMSARPFFCAYDNRYVLRSDNRWNFMFETLPFALCPNVVYWSVGIVDGSLTSRQPSFDQQHGLQQLRNITDRLGYPNTKILLALGGYQEDAAHFSRLGRDDVTMQRLMRSVLEGMRDYRLDGVTVDWMTGAPHCAQNDDKRVLEVLLRRLRESFNQHGMSQKVVSLIVRPDARDVLDSVADVVDYFFIGKDTPNPPGSTLSPNFCSTVTDLVHAEVRRYAQVAPRISLDQLCIVEDLTPILTDGIVSVSLGNKSLLQGLSKEPIYTMCNVIGICRNDSITRSCILHFVFTEPPGAPERLSAFVATSNTLTLQQRANLSAIRNLSASLRPLGQGCMLAVNLHADNFAAECPPSFRHYLLTEHIYYGTIGQVAPSPSIGNVAPRCQRY